MAIAARLTVLADKVSPMGQYALDVIIINEHYYYSNDHIYIAGTCFGVCHIQPPQASHVNDINFIYPILKKLGFKEAK